MNKITLSGLALSLMATGAFASQRNNDETAARMFFMDDVATSSEAFAVAGGSADLSAFEQLTIRADQRQNGDDR